MKLLDKIIYHILGIIGSLLIVICILSIVGIAAVMAWALTGIIYKLEFFKLLLILALPVLYIKGVNYIDKHIISKIEACKKSGFHK